MTIARIFDCLIHSMADRIVALSGGPRGAFDEAFWAGITHVSAEGYPLQGSVGAAWQPLRDFKKLPSLEDLKKGDGAISGQALTQIKEFLALCDDSTERQFFIKRGIHALWLVRKVGGYFFEARPEDPHWGCHRLAFEFVRPATGAEGAKNASLGFRTLAWMQFPVDEEAEPKLSSSPFSSDDGMLTSGKVTRKRAPKGEGAGTAKAKGTGKSKITEDVQTLEQVMEKAGKPVALTPVLGPIAPATAAATAMATAEGASAGAGAGASAGAGAGAGASLATFVRPTPPAIRPALLEAKEAPLSVEQVEVVKVRLFEHEGTVYYREPTKNKLYKRLANSSIGPYLGRWNPRLKVVDLTIPDSDGDHE